jgi:hypothetical protein
MFDVATRNKFRFASAKGDLTVEQLWDVPLRSKDDFNLNEIAKGLNRQINTQREESFVDNNKTIEGSLSIKFEIVRTIIHVKLDEEEAIKNAAAKRERRQKLMKVLEEKQDGKLNEMSISALKKEIEALS